MIIGHMTEKDIIEGLNLDYVYSNHWVVVMASAKFGTNVPEVLQWLVKTANTINKLTRVENRNKKILIIH